jgi:hypothetical protein
MEQPLATLQRTTNGFRVGSSVGFVHSAEVSTNLVQWTKVFFPDFTNWPVERAFVRVADHEWPCVEQMRSLQWAKDQWRLDRAKANTDTPAPSEIFGPTKYLPAAPFCPSWGGPYTLGTMQTKPTCAIGLNHTL